MAEDRERTRRCKLQYALALRMWQFEWAKIARLGQRRSWLAERVHACACARSPVCQATKYGRADRMTDDGTPWATGGDTASHTRPRILRAYPPTPPYTAFPSFIRSFDPTFPFFFRHFLGLFRFGSIAIFHWISLLVLLFILCLIKLGLGFFFFFGQFWVISLGHLKIPIKLWAN